MLKEMAVWKINYSRKRTVCKHKKILWPVRELNSVLPQFWQSAHLQLITGSKVCPFHHRATVFFIVIGLIALDPAVIEIMVHALRP